MREAIVCDTDESSADFDNLSFTKLRCEVKYVLEAVGCVCSHLNVAMHDCCLCDLNEALDTCRVTKNGQVWNFLGISVLERAIEQR